MRHILDEMNFLEESCQGIEFEDLMGNSEKQRAWLRSLEVIGEATKNLSKEMKTKHSEIQWKDIAGMRDKLIHEYFGVNLSLVWGTVKKNIPELEKQISEILRTTSETN